MEYEYLEAQGALHETTSELDESEPSFDLTSISHKVVATIPTDVAREYQVVPIAFDGETITVATTTPDDIALADKLRFTLAADVRLIGVPEHLLQDAIKRYYGTIAFEEVDELLSDVYSDLDAYSGKTQFGFAPGRSRRKKHRGPTNAGARSTAAVKEGASFENAEFGLPARWKSGADLTLSLGSEGMFYYTVEEGQRALVRRTNGTLEVLTGPCRVWRGFNTFRAMHHYVAHPGEYLLVRFRDGRQQHLPGPSQLWFDPREHLEVTREDALPIAAKEAVVVYSKPDSSEEVSRRIVYGPAMFVPEPGEWLHKFSWHSSQGSSQGAPKVANSLVFHKLWLMPDQMYHNVSDVRTADDAVLTIKLMVFFELLDIEKMLDTSHDPIGDFVNAATSDVVEFTGRHDFESFKQNTDRLNDLDTYKQLVGRAAQCGYRINNVVYRGYGAATSLQQMHDQAIEARTRLQLEKATEQQSQELENYKLDCQLDRASKRRGEQATEVEHDIELQKKRQAAERASRESHLQLEREQRRLEEEMRLEVGRQQDAEQREHLTSLGELGVDLTAFLTQARADRIIELRGGASGAQVHVDTVTAPEASNGRE